MSFEKELIRRKLKEELGTNKIREEYHRRYDTLEQSFVKKGKKKKNGKKI